MVVPQAVAKAAFRVPAATGRGTTRIETGTGEPTEASARTLAISALLNRPSVLRPAESPRVPAAHAVRDEPEPVANTAVDVDEGVAAYAEGLHGLRAPPGYGAPIEAPRLVEGEAAPEAQPGVPQLLPLWSRPYPPRYVPR